MAATLELAGQRTIKARSPREDLRKTVPAGKRTALEVQ
jgi:hypothetical protein